MAKFTPTVLGTLRTDPAVTSVNTNFTDIATALENTLSRNGTSPNTMGAQLDMNSHQIINLPAATVAGEAARYEDVQGLADEISDFEDDVSDQISGLTDTVSNEALIRGTADAALVVRVTTLENDQTSGQTDSAFFTQSASKARSNRSRWSDSIYVMDYNADPTGSNAGFHTVLTNSIAEAKARNRSEIRIPSGTFLLGGTVSVSNTLDRQIRIIGNERATVLHKDTGTGNWFTVGDEGIGRSQFLTFESFNCQPSVVQTAGAIFDVHNVTDIRFKNIEMTRDVTAGVGGVRQAFALGTSSGMTNSVVYVDIQDCTCTPNTQGAAVIEIGSGSVLNIRGSGRWNGTGSTGLRFIKQSGNTWNWDGLYCYDLFLEDFLKYVEVTGAGVVNLTWTGGQVDRFVGGAFDTSNQSATGHSNNWLISGTQMLRGDFPLVFSPHGGQAFVCNFIGNVIRDCTSYILIVAGAIGVNIVGNTFYNCSNGTQHISYGGTGLIAGNTSWRNSDASAEGSTTAPLYGVLWTDGALSNRDTANNIWSDASSAAEHGTK